MSQSAEILKPFGEYATPGRQEAVIEILQNWLKQAENGEIIAVAVAGMKPNGVQVTNWDAGSANGTSLYGAACFVAHRIAAALNEDD